MMSVWHLLWIVPMSMTLGGFFKALIDVNNRRDSFDIEKFKQILERFAEHLREFGEIKAAEAVETTLKYIRKYGV